MTSSHNPDYQSPVARTTEEAATKSPNEARQGIELGTMRFVLTISVIGAVVALSIAYLVFAR